MFAGLENCLMFATAKQPNICKRMLMRSPVRCEDDASSTIPDFAYHIPKMSFGSRIHACGWFI
jgi:hypothetical protein